MEYNIILDPALKLNANRFVTTWNSDSRCRDVAIAQVQTIGAHSYDPALTELVNLVIIPLAVSVAANALYDLIKDVFLQSGVQKRIHIISEKQPDGHQLTIVTIDESIT